MKKMLFIIFFVFIIIPLNAQTVNEWLRSIDMATRAVSVLRGDGNPSYEISSLNDGGYIVHDVYGSDERVYQNGDAIIIGRVDLRVLDTKYSQMFRELLYTYRQPIRGEAAYTGNNGNTTSVFNIGQVPTANGLLNSYLELRLSVYAQELSLKKYNIIMQ